MADQFYDVDLAQLYDAGMAWIAELWQGNEILSTNILPKCTGRNPGFALLVCIHFTDQKSTIQVRYYVKMEDIELNMVLSHWMLKELKCGPERCFFKILRHSKLNSSSKPFVLGVITEEVADFQTAKAAGLSDQCDRILDNESTFLVDSFILTIAAHLGQFSRIPDNRENWGFVRLAQHTMEPGSRISIIDFSSYDYYRSPFDSRERFLAHWASNCSSMIYQYRVTDPLNRTHADWKRNVTQALDRQHQHFPWLQSKAAFQEVLQRACDRTAEWLHTCATSPPPTALKSTADPRAAALDKLAGRMDEAFRMQKWAQNYARSTLSTSTSAEMTAAAQAVIIHSESGALLWRSVLLLKHAHVNVAAAQEADDLFVEKWRDLVALTCGDLTSFSAKILLSVCGAQLPVTTSSITSVSTESSSTASEGVVSAVQVSDSRQNECNAAATACPQLQALHTSTHEDAASPSHFDTIAPPAPATGTSTDSATDTTLLKVGCVVSAAGFSTAAPTGGTDASQPVVERDSSPAATSDETLGRKNALPVAPSGPDTTTDAAPLVISGPAMLRAEVVDHDGCSNTLPPTTEGEAIQPPIGVQDSTTGACAAPASDLFDAEVAKQLPQQLSTSEMPVPLLQRLEAYRLYPRITDSDLPDHIALLYDEYERRVQYLNKQLDLFSAWFPYPTN